MRGKVLISMMLMALTEGAMSGELVNVDENRVALRGYDPVAFFTEGRAVAGKPSITAAYQGATYRFATAGHKDLSLADKNWPGLVRKEGR